MKKDISKPVRYYLTKLNSLPEAPQTTRQAPDSALHVILKKAGYQKKGPKVLKELDAALRDAGIETFPRLTDPRIEKDTKIYFFRSPMPEGLAQSAELFTSEDQLEEFLVNNFKYLRLFEGLRLRGRQYEFPNSKRIDLLCEESRSGRLVGVELKHHSPNPGIVTQVSGYMRQLLKLSRLEERAAGARLVVITGLPDPNIAADLRALCRDRGYEIEWHLYRARLEFLPEPNWR
ncbi:MAG TPA: hypothetical protein ENI86_00990 [Acidimicrobiales bacterium]|nr:hypothetical protein [Acidimicrobiales bacterium]